MTIQVDRSGESPKVGEVCPNSGWNRDRGMLGRRLLMAVLVLALVGAPSASFADGKAKETSREGGLGAAAAISSLVYGPVKLVYAVGGLIVGSFAWAFTAGDSQVAEKVFTRSLRGTYVITPDILTGEQELFFIGRDVEGTGRTDRNDRVDRAHVDGGCGRQRLRRVGLVALSPSDRACHSTGGAR